MTLTSDETIWITTAILVAHSSLVAWVIIKTQHAKNAAEATDEIKNIFVRLVFWVSNIFAVTLLVLEFLSSDPITRKDIFLIILCISILFLSLIYALLKTMRDLLKLQMRITELLDKSVTIPHNNRLNTDR